MGNRGESTGWSQQGTHGHRTLLTTKKQHHGAGTGLDNRLFSELQRKEPVRAQKGSPHSRDEGEGLTTSWLKHVLMKVAQGHLVKVTFMVWHFRPPRPSPSIRSGSAGH